MMDVDRYKKQLEDFLQEINFFYSGDIINSVEKTFCQRIKNVNFSSTMVRDVLLQFYNSSFDEMISKSKEIIVHRNDFIDVYQLMDKIPIDTKILFYSVNSNLNLNLGSHILESVDDGRGYLPNYFNRRFKLMSHNREVSAYYSPLINDDIDDCHFYLVDRPIQSMVWSIQNMSYSITKGFSSNEHVVKIPFYYCDYNSYKIRVVNTQKLRNDKINSLLDGN